MLIDQVAAVFLISVGSGLILTLAGVLKDIVSNYTFCPYRVLILAPHLRFRPCLWFADHRSPGLWLLVSLTWNIAVRALLTSSISLGGLIMFKQTGGK